MKDKIKARNGHEETLLLDQGRHAKVWEDDGRIVLSVTVGAVAPLSVDLAPYEAAQVARLLRRAVKPANQPAPRYDDVHADGVAWLDELAKGPSGGSPSDGSPSDGSPSSDSPSSDDVAERGAEKLVELDPATAERTGRVTAEEAREIAQRFIDGHFRNAGKEGPRISIPADPMRDDDIRLVAFIEQSAAEIERLREDLDQKARAGAGVAFDLKELQDDRDELRAKLDTAERESCAAIQKLTGGAS